MWPLQIVSMMQAESLKHSPRMVITPRQVQDHSEEISTLKAELAALKDEVGCLPAQLQLLFSCMSQYGSDCT